MLQDRLYINDGKGNFTRNKTALPVMHVSKSCVAINDVNQDGHLDLFVGGRVIPGRYPEAPASYLLINDGKGNFTNQISSLAPQLEKLGMITDAIWLDVNNDQKNDLIVVGEWLPMSVFVNTNNTLQNETTNYFGKEYRGWWNKIETGDFNNDQKPDLIIGNVGTNFQLNASDKQPVEMYCKDFDKNGSVDPFLCSYIQGKSYPYVTRDELLEQIGSLRSRFTTYKSYADITLKDLFKEEDLKGAEHWQANRFETTFFKSTSEGKFEEGILPIEVQYSPVYTITRLDYNSDGNSDVLLCGNESHFKLRLGKSDANFGILLRGNGKGEFDYVNQALSGFQLRGDVRSVIEVNKTLLFGISQQTIKAYESTK
jgi:hypothetical protein